MFLAVLAVLAVPRRTIIHDVNFSDHLPTMACNAAIRGPRHAVFLRDRTPTRHCAFSEDMSRMVYAPDKMHLGIRGSYSPPDHQVSNRETVNSYSIFHESVGGESNETRKCLLNALNAIRYPRRFQDCWNRWSLS